MDHHEFISEFVTIEEPEQFLRVSRKNGIIEALFPRLAALWGEEGTQDARWHPEGNVWNHVLLVIRGVCEVEDDATRSRLRLTGLFHDIGKPLTQRIWPSGGMSNKGHAEAGARLFRDEIVPRAGIPPDVARDVFEMIFHHDLVHTKPDEHMAKVREMVLQLSTIRELLLFERVDVFATTRSRQDCADSTAAADWENLLMKKVDDSVDKGGT